MILRKIFFLRFHQQCSNCSSMWCSSRSSKEIREWITINIYTTKIYGSINTVRSYDIRFVPVHSIYQCSST